MGSREKWYTEKLNDLQQEDLRVSTLGELRDRLKSLPHDEAEKVTKALELPLVFDCLNDNNTEQVDLACEVLSLCLGNLHLGESTSRYQTAFERALNHPFPGVKLMVLKEIERSLLNEEVVSSFCQQTPLLINIVNCIADEDIGVANKASDILVALGITIPGANKITSNEILVPLQELMTANQIVKARVFETLVSISKKSEFSFAKLKAVGLISNIVDEIANSDVLFKMNVIEILSQLGQSEHGFVFLDETDVLNKIFNIIGEDELTAQLCQPGILKFFGHVAHRNPRELLAKYPIMFDHLFSNIEQSDLTLIAVSLDTIGFIGQTSQGKLALDSTGKRFDGTIKIISRLLSSLPTDVRVRALNCIGNLLRDTRYDIMQITEKWYRLLGTDPMEIITKYAKNPFPELRLAGLGIVNSLASQPWGQDVIKNTPGLVEFLLDRSIETNKECKEAKYEIVKLLSNSTIFDRHIQERLENFVKEGPFYVQPVVEVAIEGD
ncbi:hypothetical protein ABEB36_014906 [Hypothenemus hampei]|uniref:26S proteasome non-ATPase regulatory subunit 5 n=1 Tax=Hypothenemus hampei TaxID=57062 RepID=A0ABD1E182_HYPHA